jgi:hypothetical protein
MQSTGQRALNGDGFWEEVIKLKGQREKAGRLRSGNKETEDRRQKTGDWRQN